MKTLKDLGDLKGKRVLVRADFNVPLDGTTITDDGRIKAALPTIKALREEGAKVILMAHLGRPKGKVVPELSLAPVAARLGELLGVEVPLAADTYGEDAQAKVAAMNDGDVVLLQNVRFNPEETSKDPEERAAYAKKIAALGEAFVSDGFGVVHRAQGSNYDVAADLPAAAGLLVEKEVKALSRATENPERPLTVVLGGSKVSDKLGVIDNLLDKANRLVIGGGMAYTFLKAKGYEVGTSLLEEDQIETVKGYMERAEKNGVELVLPTDVVLNPVFPKLRRGHRSGSRGSRRHSGRQDGSGHRPGVSEAVPRQDRRFQDRRVERPDGRVRGPDLRRRHQGRGTGPGRRYCRRRIHHCRWRRFRFRSAQPRLPRGRLLPHLHRWRRLP